MTSHRFILSTPPNNLTRCYAGFFCDFTQPSEVIFLEKMVLPAVVSFSELFWLGKHTTYCIFHVTHPFSVFWQKSKKKACFDSNLEGKKSPALQTDALPNKTEQWTKCGFGPSENGSPRQGYPPKRDMNAERSSTNEPHEQTSVFIVTSFSCGLGDRTRDLWK